MKPETAQTLPDALVSEMARIRDHVLPYYTPEVNGGFAASMMRRDLDAAARAMAEGDAVEMARLLHSLRGWKT